MNVTFFVWAAMVNAAVEVIARAFLTAFFFAVRAKRKWWLFVWEIAKLNILLILVIS